MKRWLIVTACGTTLLLVVAVAVVVASRNRQRSAPPPEVPVEASPAVVRVKAEEPKGKPLEMRDVSAVSGALAIICGEDDAAADCYEAWNDALRSIARRRDLSVDEVATLMEYVASTNYVMRVEREAALRNDVLNLLRNQKQQPEGLADLLVGMVASGLYAPVIIDYCLQHLGAMANTVADDAMQARIRETFVAAAKTANEPYAGTALYSLAELPQKSKDEGDELRRLTIGLCNASANPIARIAAIQLAGERGYRDVLPTLREVLAGARRDAVLDMAVVGSVGLLGDAKDVQMLESFRSRGGRRLKLAIDAAVQRIKERAGAN